MDKIIENLNKFAEECGNVAVSEALGIIACDLAREREQTQKQHKSDLQTIAGLNLKLDAWASVINRLANHVLDRDSDESHRDEAEEAIEMVETRLASDGR